VKAGQKAAVKLASAVALGLYLAGAESPGGGSLLAAGIPATVSAVPAGASYTPQSWAPAFLSVISEPQTPCNDNAIVAWEAAEGGAWNNSADGNPLNTTQPEPGDWSINSAGVKAYPSWQEGLRANATAITNGLYGSVLAALRQGNDAQAVADAVASSPWGTSPFSASC
jgi:hypothetical protein